jgi:drug/metabolite transporter (DMT)-like permease
VTEVQEIAAVLALLAAAFFALAATLWQRASLNLSEVSFRRPATFLALFIQWVWLLGLAAQGVGVALQGAALDRGRLAIVQPLLVTSVIFAMPLGYFLTGQKITGRQVFGAAVTVVGLAVFAVVGDPAGGVDNAPTSEWLVAFVIIGALCVALLAFGRGGDETVRAATYGVVAGMLFGVSATLMKPVVETMHTDGWDVLAGWQLWALAATGIVGFLLQQISLSTGRLVTSVASVSVANPVVSVTLGAVLLEERLARPTWHVVVAVIALAVALLGVVVITSSREQASEPAVRVASA